MARWEPTVRLLELLLLRLAVVCAWYSSWWGRCSCCELRDVGVRGGVAWLEALRAACGGDEQHSVRLVLLLLLLLLACVGSCNNSSSCCWLAGWGLHGAALDVHHDVADVGRVPGGVEECEQVRSSPRQRCNPTGP